MIDTNTVVTTDSSGKQVGTEYQKAQESKGILTEETGAAIDMEEATEQKGPTDPTPEENLAELNASQKDWIETRLLSPGISKENLYEVYGSEGFNKFKSKEDYWDNDKIKEMFVNQYGYDAKYEFDKMYDVYKQEFAQFELGNFMRSQSGYELIRDDLSDLRATANVRFENSLSALMRGDEWGEERRDFRENFNKINKRVTNDDGVEEYKIVDYSPEALKELEENPYFDGLAYSDKDAGRDPYAPTDGFVYEAIYDGKILDVTGKKQVDVRDDQIVSQWDLETGSVFDGLLRNNKLEAEGIMDYAKIIIKGPVNMALNLLDTVTQLTRASWAVGYGLVDKFTVDALKVDDSATYKALSSFGVRTKKYTTSNSSESMRDGYFGSLESALTTTFDVILQVALASALGKLSAKAAKSYVGTGASAATILRAQGRAAKVAVRGTLTAMATKDSYNEALAMGYTNTEAGIYTAAIGGAMWVATSQASYIIGDFGAKQLRRTVHNAVKEDIRKNFTPAIKRAIEAGLKKGSPEAKKHFAALAMARAQKVIGGVFNRGSGATSAVRKALNSNQWIYASKQEAIEEMSEELGQDLVKHAASAYGYLLNDAKEVGKGRFQTFMDDGWYEHVIERYATSMVAGGFGGVAGMKMSPHRITLSDITDTSSITEIIHAGHGAELVVALDKLRAQKKLGPEKLAAEYNYDLKIFEPMVEGSDSESLSDMVYKTYLHDFNVIDTFINQGQFGEARKQMEDEFRLRDSVDNNAMRKDFSKILASIIEFHGKTGITTKIYEEMDPMDAAQLKEYMPEALDVMQTTLDAKKKDLIEYQQKLKKDRLKRQSTQEDDDDEDTGTIPKEDEDIATGQDKLMIDHLKERIQEVENLGESDIKTMLQNYKMLRAVASGATAEYYLMQNQVHKSPVLGDVYNRKDEFKDLGKTPLRDMLFAMRFRLLEDKQNELYTQEKAVEIEGQITAMDGLTSEDVAKLEAIVRENGDKLTKASVEHVNDLYARMTMPIELFDINSPNSIFEKGADGKATKESMDDVYIGLLLENNAQNQGVAKPQDGLFFGEAIRASNDSIEFFEKAAKDGKELQVPTYIDEYTYIEATSTTDYLIENILNSKNAKLASKLNSSLSKIKLDFRALANGPRFAAEAFYDPNKGDAHPLQTMLRTSSPKGLGVDTVLSKGLTEVVELLDSGMGPKKNIFTKTETSILEDVKRQTQIKQALASELSMFTRPIKGLEILRNKNINMLANFRLNVLDIINFKYKIGTIHNSRLEEHPYKEYTAFSDFFLDFVYDPLAVKKVFSKEESDRTDADKAILARIDSANRILVNNDGENIHPIDVPAELIKLTFLNKFGNLDGVSKLRAAVEFFRDPESELVVTHAGTDYVVKMNGITGLVTADILFERAIIEIEKVKGLDSPLPYIKEKEQEVKDAFDIYTDLFGGNDAFGRYLGDMVHLMVPEFRDVLDGDGPKNKSTIDLGRINIKVENALFKIYNKDASVTFLSDPDYDGANLNLDIDAYIKDKIGQGMVDQDNPTNILSRKAGIMVMGAVTTDFTPFYSKFKGLLNNSTENDNVVLAAQEQTAKYVAAYMYSERFKDYAHGLYSKGSNTGTYIKGIYGSGTAGSGKSSATIELGASIGVSILKDDGASNIAVLPVANNASQISILENSVGELSLGNKGMTPAELETLLKIATTEKGEKADAAIEKLKTLGAIVIDEVTYVQAFSNTAEGDALSQLKNIAALLDTFNDAHNMGGNTISLIMLGDPKQSGAYKVVDKHILLTALEPGEQFALPYMSFSFRNRNSFLTSSIDAIKESAPKVRSSDIQSIKGVTLKPGLKYGSMDGRKYGVNLSSANDVESDEDFMAVMRDGTLVANIKSNIDKSIEENKDKQPGDPGYKKPFEVIIAPSSMDDFMKAESAMMTQLIKDPVYKNHIKIIPYSLIGGSEANYVFAEIPQLPFDNTEVLKGTGFAQAIHKSLNTLATRAFDYVHIIDRSEGIIISTESRPKEMADDEVHIPNSEIDGAAKLKVKEHYLAIMSGIKADGSIIPSKPSVIITNTEEFIPPADIDRAHAEINVKLIGDLTTVLNVSGINTVLEEIGDSNFTDINSLIASVNLVLSSDSDNVLANHDKAKQDLEKLKEVLGTKQYEEFEFLIASARVFQHDSGNGTIRNIFDKKLQTLSDILNMGMEEYFALYPTSNTPINVIIESLQEELKNNADDHKKLFKNALSPGTRDEKAFKKEAMKVASGIAAVLSATNTTAVREVKDMSEEAQKALWTLISGVTEVAAILYNADNVSEQVLEDSNNASVAGFDSWLDAKSADEIIGVQLELNRIAALETVVGEVLALDKSGHAELLFKTYTTESVLKILSEVTSLRYQIKRAQERANNPSGPNIIDHYAEFETLKAKVGIPADVLAKHEIRTAIEAFVEKANKSGKKEDIYNAEQLKKLYDLIYATTPDDAFNKNDTWYSRGAKGAETLEDYIKRRIEDSKGDHMYTIHVKDTTFKYGNITKSFDTDVTYKQYKDPKTMLNLFGYGMGAPSTFDNAPTRLGLRAIRNSRTGAFNLLLVGIKGDVRHILSQIPADNANTPEGKAIIEDYKSKGDYPAEMIQKIHEIMDARTDPRLNEDGERMYLDVELEDSVEKTMLFRAGNQIMPGYNENGATLAELRTAGINVDGHVYVYTRPTNDNELSGEAYVMYTPNNSINLSSPSIREDNVDGVIVADGKVIVDSSSAAPTELGLLPVHIEPNFVRLGEALSKVDGNIIGEMPTKMSLLIQKHIGAYIQAMKVGDTLSLETPSGTPDLVAITDGVVKQGNNMSAGYINHTDPTTANKHGSVRKDLRDSIEASYTIMMKSAELKNVLDQLAGAYVKDFVSNGGKSTSLIYKQADGDAYILAINSFLKSNNKVFLEYLTKIAAITKYSIKPTITSSTGKSINVGLINDIFVKELSDLIRVVPKGIGLPMAQVNSEGKAAFTTVLDNPPAKKKNNSGGNGFTYDATQQARRDQIVNFRSEMISIENIDSADFANRIKAGKALVKDIENFPSMEQDKIALIAGIADMETWADNLSTNLFGMNGAMANADEFSGLTLYEKVFGEEPEGDDLKSDRAIALGTILLHTSFKQEESMLELISVLNMSEDTDTFEDLSEEMGNITNDADKAAIQALLDNKCVI